MQVRHSVRFQRFDDAIENQRDSDCRDEEADDARDGIDPHRAQCLRKPARVVQAKVRHEHRRNDGGDDGDE